MTDFEILNPDWDFWEWAEAMQCFDLDAACLPDPNEIDSH
tara:strand:- start:47 stop:166 length:120 start_codon:yes stop_codon:yes gene_type:complete